MKVNGMNNIEYAAYLVEQCGWSEEMACMETNYVFEKARTEATA